VALRAPCARARQQREAAVQVLGDLGRRERADPRRRELERERQPVEPAADVGDRRPVLVVDLEVPADEPSPVEEELHRLRRGRLRGRARVRDLERAQREHRFAVDPERLAAGGQHARVRAGLEHPFRQLRHAAHHVLAVVEHHQEVALVDGVDHRLRRSDRGAVAPDRRGYGRSDRRLVVERAQKAPADQGRVGLGREHLGRQPRLAHPAHPGDRGQRTAPDQLREPHTLALAPEERGPRRRSGCSIG
jgi:hypothetical protein